MRNDDRGEGEDVDRPEDRDGEDRPHAVSAVHPLNPWVGIWDILHPFLPRKGRLRYRR